MVPEDVRKTLDRFLESLKLKGAIYDEPEFVLREDGSYDVFVRETKPVEYIEIKFVKCGDDLEQG